MRLFHHATAIVSPALQLAPAKPDVRAGLRAALMTVGPLVVSAVLGIPPLAWMSLAGFITCVTDKGGAYQTRAVTTGAVTVIGVFAVIVGALAGHHLAWALPLMFLFGWAGGLARVYGTEATVVGAQVAVVFTASLATPVTTPHDAVSRGVSYLVGGALAMGLSLFLWPIRFYAPVRRVVVQCYEELAGYASALSRRADGDWSALSRVAHLRIREAIEDARATIVAARRGRMGESGRGVRLLLLLDQMERLFTLLASIGEQLDVLDPSAGDFRSRCDQLLRALSIELEAIARLISTEIGAPTLVSRWDPSALVSADHQKSHIASLFEQVRVGLHRATATANGLERGGPLQHLSPSPTPTDDRWTARLITPVLANLTTDSIAFRHAVRVGVLSALGVGLTHWFKLPMGHWVTLTIVLILQPYLGATTLRGIQRAGGTVLGGMLAALLAALVHDSHWILALVFVFTAISVSLLPLNYGLFSMLLTPTFVLLTEMRLGNWHLAEVRITNSLIGAAIAFVGSLVLWPSPERRRLPAELAAALQAIRLYLRATTDFLVAPTPANREALTKAQRGSGLALINAEASFQRLLTESAQQPAPSERYMAVLIHARRLISTVTSLGFLSGHLAKDSSPKLIEFTEHLEARLARASEQLGPGGALPAEEAPLTVPSVRDEVLLSQVERLSRRVADLLRELRVVAAQTVKQ